MKIIYEHWEKICAGILIILIIFFFFNSSKSAKIEIKITKAK
jgi:hypothetical protein